MSDEEKEEENVENQENEEQNNENEENEEQNNENEQQNNENEENEEQNNENEEQNNENEENEEQNNENEGNNENQENQEENNENEIKENNENEIKENNEKEEKEENEENEEKEEKKEKKEKKEKDEEKEEKEIEDEQEPENVEAEKESTFISRYFSQPEEFYTKERYLLSIMRISIIERIFRIFFFQSKSKEMNLYPLFDMIKKDEKKLKLFENTSKFLSEKITEDSPLSFFNEVMKEINRLNKINDLNNLKFDKYILKFEFLLAWHFENNFLIKNIDNRLGMGYYDNIQIMKGKTNYVYSIECLNTIFKFMYIFEKQSLSTRIENEFPLIHNLFCIEKIYYFYCDKLNREKIPSGNIVKYLLEQVMARMENSKNSKEGK